MLSVGQFLTVARELTGTERWQLNRSEATRLTNRIYVNNTDQWNALKPWEKHRHLSFAAALAHPTLMIAGHAAAEVLQLPFEAEGDWLIELRRRGPHGKNDVFAWKRTPESMFERAARKQTKQFSILTTSVEDIIFDTTQWHSTRSAIQIADEALKQKLVSKESLTRVLDSRGRGRKIDQCRNVLAIATNCSGSPAESALRLAMLTNGIGDFYIQSHIYNRQGLFLGCPDFLFPQYGLIVEYDGVLKYTDESKRSVVDALREDMHRQHVLGSEGFRIVRIDKEKFKNGTWLPLIQTAIAETPPNIDPNKWVFQHGPYFPPLKSLGL